MKKALRDNLALLGICETVGWLVSVHGLFSKIEADFIQKSAAI